MAMGCDDGILIDEASPLDSLTTAKAMAKAIQQEGEFSAIFTGVLSIDDNESAMGPMLAEFLQIPHVGVVSQLDSTGDEWTAEREVEGGTKEVFNIKLPGLITATKGLNKPRFASLPNIMKAKKKPIKEMSLSDLGFSSDDVKIQLNQYQMPAEKEPVKMLTGDSSEQVSELVKLLRDEAKVL